MSRTEIVVFNESVSRPYSAMGIVSFRGRNPALELDPSKTCLPSLNPLPPAPTPFRTSVSLISAAGNKFD